MDKHFRRGPFFGQWRDLDPVLSFHRPLRDYWQAFAEAGFTVDGFEEPSVTERGRRELPASRVERSLRTPFSCIFRLVKPSDARSSPQASGTCQQAASTGRPADEQLPSGKDTAWQRYRPSGEFPVAASPWAPAEARMNGYWAGPMTSCVA